MNMPRRCRWPVLSSGAMDTPGANFLGIEMPSSRPADAEAVIVPIPFERTVSYGRGTAAGPRAILEASTQVEFYDEVAGDEPGAALTIATLPPVLADDGEFGAAIDTFEAAVRPHLAAGQFTVALGGEHSLTTGPVRAAQRTFGDIGVLQFDAHADLRDRYEGTPWSHASVMRRVRELQIPTAAIGLRSLSAPEAALIRECRIPVIWGYQLHTAEDNFSPLLDALPEQVYLSFDLDFFDPAILPATGTPEPGGGTWWPTLRLLERLFQQKRVVAMDVVELAPIPGQPASDFLAARLVYKCLGFWWRARRAVDH